MTATRIRRPQLRAASTDQSLSLTSNDLSESSFHKTYFCSDSSVREDVAEIPFVAKSTSIELQR